MGIPNSKNPDCVPSGHKPYLYHKPRGKKDRTGQLMPSMSPGWQGSAHWCLHQSPSLGSPSRFANKSDKKICGEFYVTPAESRESRSAQTHTSSFSPHCSSSGNGNQNHFSGLHHKFCWSSALSLTRWHLHIKITEWFHWVQSEWSSLRTHSSSLQQSGTLRAGGHTLTITFHRHWNTSLPFRCLVPFGICVYFQSSCHLIATCSTNQLCWKRISSASWLINNFAGCTSSALWEIAKFIKVNFYSTSPYWTQYYRYLLFPSIIYFCLFNLSSYRNYPSPLIIPFHFPLSFPGLCYSFWKRVTSWYVTPKMQAQHVYLAYKNIYQQILFPVFFGYSWTFSWCVQVTIHSDSK